jgi:1-phosphatidylinositol phosphodiesterase
MPLSSKPLSGPFPSSHFSWFPDLKVRFLFLCSLVALQNRTGGFKMAPPLVFRNLTATPIEVKLIERFEAPGSEPPKLNVTGISNIGDVGRNLTNITSFVTNTVAQTATNVTAPSSGQLAENAQSFSHQDVSIRVEPFARSDTGIQATERNDREVLRVTIEVEGQRYRIDVPNFKKESQAFTPLVPDPRFQLTGVFLKDDTFLSVYSSANLHKWMENFKDETPLSALSIPGTHNSPTCHRALPSVRCQAVSPWDQMQNGVRFFDIRVQPETPEDPSKDGLILVHGVFPISLTGNKYFRDLVNDVHRFLDENPSETLIMSIKREGPGQHTDQQLSRILRDHYCGDNNKWYTEPRIPRLGEARHRIVLMRRFCLDERETHEWGGRGWGINAENWRYNCDNDTHGDVCVQDYCEVNETMHIDEKIKFAEDHLGRAGGCIAPLPKDQNDHPNPGPFYLNFLSASNFWKFACWPEKIAARLNPAIIKQLCMKHHEGEGDGSTGIVITDWVGEGGDWDLIRCIVGMNAKLEMREKGLR